MTVVAKHGQLLATVAADPDVKARLAFIDHNELLRAGRNIAASLNVLNRLETWEARIAPTKRKTKSLPLRVEANYVRALRQFHKGSFPAGIDGVRTLLDQLEISGANLVVSRLFQDSLSNGKLALGAMAVEVKSVFSKGVEVSGLATLLGLDGAIVSAIPGILPTVPIDMLINIAVIMPIDRDQLAQWLVGHGISDDYYGQGGSGGDTGGGTSAHIQITKGVNLLIQDLLFVTEMTTTEYVVSRMIAGVPLASPIQWGWFAVGAALAVLGILTGGLNGGTLFSAGIAVMFFALLGWIGVTSADAAGFVDP